MGQLAQLPHDGDQRVELHRLASLHVLQHGSLEGAQFACDFMPIRRLPIAQQPSDRHEVTRKLGAFKTSMLQDVEAGKAVELDALVTVVRELGQLTHVATPFTDALLGLARLQASVRGLY